MLVKFISYSPDKNLLRDKLAERFAPVENAGKLARRSDKVAVSNTGHVLAYYDNNNNLKNVAYYNVSKTETHSNGPKSIAVMQIDDSYIPLMIEPLILDGALEIIGDVVTPDVYLPDILTDDEKALIQSINPKWFSTETVNIFGQEIEIQNGFIEVQ